MRKIREIYKNAFYEIRTKVMIFNVITIVSLCFLLGLMFLRIRDGIDPLTILTNFIAGLIIFTGILWQQKCKYDQASTLTITLLATIIISIGIPRVFDRIPQDVKQKYNTLDK